MPSPRSAIGTFVGRGKLLEFWRTLVPARALATAAAVFLHCFLWCAGSGARPSYQPGLQAAEQTPASQAVAGAFWVARRTPTPGPRGTVRLHLAFETRLGWCALQPATCWKATQINPKSSPGAVGSKNAGAVQGPPGAMQVAMSRRQGTKQNTRASTQYEPVVVRSHGEAPASHR